MSRFLPSATVVGTTSTRASADGFWNQAIECRSSVAATSSGGTTTRWSVDTPAVVGPGVHHVPDATKVPSMTHTAASATLASIG
jgi:hypothetical protein